MAAVDRVVEDHGDLDGSPFCLSEGVLPGFLLCLLVSVAWCFSPGVVVSFRRSFLCFMYTI